MGLRNPPEFWQECAKSPGRVALFCVERTWHRVTARLSSSFFALVSQKEQTVSLQQQIDKDYITAYKAKETVRVSVLRMLKTSVKNRLVDLCRPGGELTDEEMMDVLIKEAKQRRDSISEYNKASRPDLADKEAQELVILEGYLPKALSDEELAKAIEDMVAKVGAKGPADMGKVMGSLMKAYKGRVDGGKLSQAVKARLAAL